MIIKGVLSYMKVDKNLKRLERHLNSNTGRVLNCKFKIIKDNDNTFVLLYNNKKLRIDNNEDMFDLIYSVSERFLTNKELYNFAFYYDWLGEVNWDEV